MKEKEQDHLLAQGRLSATLRERIFEESPRVGAHQPPQVVGRASAGGDPPV